MYWYHPPVYLYIADQNLSVGHFVRKMRKRLSDLHVHSNFRAFRRVADRADVVVVLAELTLDEKLATTKRPAGPVHQLLRSVVKDNTANARRKKANITDMRGQRRKGNVRNADRDVFTFPLPDPYTLKLLPTMTKAGTNSI